MTKEDMKATLIEVAINSEKDRAVAKCWSESSTKPMTEFIKKYEEFFEFSYDEWLKADSNSKWLSIIKQTQESRNPNVKKYRNFANLKEREINEKLKAKEPLPFD